MRIIGLMSNIGCGGAEIQSILLFNGLCRNGFELKIVVLDTERIELADRLDARIEKVFIKRKTYFDVNAMLKVKEQVADFNPDVLILVDNYPTLYGRALRILGIKTRAMTILHNTVASNLKRELQNRLIYGPSINRLDKVIFVSQNQKRYWIDRYKVNETKAAVILNGIDTDFFESYYRENNMSECRKKLSIPLEKIVIAMNASLWAHKSHEHMIEAIHRLKNAGFNFFLIIIGDGPRRIILEQMVKEKDLHDDVLFTGFVSDVRPYLMCADISALTSTGTETLSLAAIESMALGKALILSDTGGSSEIVDSGQNGYLYTPGSIDELVCSIIKINCSKQYVSMGKRSQEKAKNLFSLDRMIGQYIELIKNCMAE